MIHHTVTANDYSESEAASIVLGICRYHRNANGWNDIGYQALVDRFGNVYQGRAGGMTKAVVGAQAQGFNEQTTAISSIGTHTKEAPTRGRAASRSSTTWPGSSRSPASTRSARRRWSPPGGELSRYPAGRRVRLHEVIGHRTLGLTACPGEALDAMLVEHPPQDRRRGSSSSAGVEPPTATEPPTGGGGVQPSAYEPLTGPQLARYAGK